MVDMIYKPLGKTGLKVSAIGFGATTLGNEYGDITAEMGTRAVHAAIERGVNFFDTSPYYGRTLSETRLGEALAGYRDKVLIATKCGRYDKDLPHGFDFSAKRLVASVEESLTRLKTDVIDLFQLHDIEFTHKQQIIDESLPTLYKLREQGKVRFVGITGYPIHLLQDVAEQMPVDTILSYCHYNLMNTTLEKKVIPFVEAHGLGLIIGSPLHMGLLTEAGAPDWHPGPIQIHRAARQAAEIVRQGGGNISTLALQFVLQNAAISTMLVGMRSEAEVEQNLALVGTQPDPQLLARVQEVLAPVKDINWESGLPENNEPGALPQHTEPL